MVPYPMEHGEILRKDENEAAVDGAVSNDHPIAGNLLSLIHAEIGAAMFLEHVPFLEGIRIEQQLDAFAGGQLALGVLAVDALLATAEAGHFTFFFELADDVVHGKLPGKVGSADSVFQIIEQRMGGGGGGRAALLDGLDKCGQIGPDPRVMAEKLAQPGVDQLPHPAQ